MVILSERFKDEEGMIMRRTLCLMALVAGFMLVMTHAALASNVSCVPDYAADRFGSQCEDSDPMPKRKTGAVGQRMQDLFNVLIPPRTKIESELAGNCSSRYWETSSSAHSFIAFTTAYSLRAVPGNSGGAVDPVTCTPDVYVRSLVSRGINSGVRYAARLASADSSGQRVPGTNSAPSISANGRFVCFSNLNGGTPSGIFRKDLWTGALTTVVPGAAGICSTANDGKVAVDYRSAIGQSVAFFEISEDGTVTELFRETAVQFGNTPTLGERALNPSGSVGMFLRSNVTQGNVIRLRFTSEDGSPTTVNESTIENYVRNAADRPAFSTGGNDAMWLATNPNWNPTTEIVGGGSNERAMITGEANGYWYPKTAPRTGGRYWIYRGFNEAKGYPDPQNHGTDAIYLLRGPDIKWNCRLYVDLNCTEETHQPLFETGNENACRISANKFGLYRGDGKTEGNTISGDGAFVAFASDKSVLDVTGTNDDAPSYPSAYVYVRFTDMYEECKRLEGSEDVLLAQTYRPLMYYDVNEKFFASSLEMWQTGKFGLEPTQVKRCETGLKTLMPFGTKCPFPLTGPHVSTIDSNMEDINLLPTGDDQMFLDSPGDGGDALRHASDFKKMLDGRHTADSMYFRSVPVPATGGKIIQYEPS